MNFATLSLSLFLSVLAALAVACESTEGGHAASTELDPACTETLLLHPGEMNPVRTFQFDDSGRVTGSLTVASDGTVVGDESRVYDAAGFLIEAIERTRLGPSEPAVWQAVRTTYTFEADHVSFTAVVVEDGVPTRTWSADLNAAGDPIKEYFPDSGDTYFYSYDDAGLLIESRRESDQGFEPGAVAYVYAGGRLIREDHTTAGVLTQVVDYLYSEGGLELRISNPGTQGSRKYKTFEYDAQGRQLSETFWQDEDAWDYRREWGYACWDAP